MDNELPDWIEPRDSQLRAVDEIVAAFDKVPVVVFQGPTGTGKTIVAEMVRRRLNLPTLYVCSDKGLQTQFCHDFPYGRLLQGRANYPTELDATKSADDCGGDRCFFCHERWSCPYQRAKKAALTSDLAVLNTSYLLAEANYIGGFSKRELVVVDEGDLLEDSLVNFVQYTSPKWLLERVNMDAPIKGAHRPTIVKWLGEFAEALKLSVDGRLMGDVKMHNALLSGVRDALRVKRELEGEEGEESAEWLREYRERKSGRKWVDDEQLHMKPVLVESYGTKMLWRHSKKWLIMSATIISAAEMMQTLGMPLDWEYVEVPMEFPVEHRPIIMAPVADVTYSMMYEAAQDIGYALWQISKQHKGERVLVHTVSYNLTKMIEREVAGYPMEHRVLAYYEGRDKGTAMMRYLRESSTMLLAPSMTRGVDLSGDKCRVQVIVKCPFPNLGDKRTSARVRMPDGDLWYTVKTIREIVQMTGRAVRGMDDYATTYVLDKQFSKNLWKKRELFPGWWKDAVNTGADIKHMIRH